MLHLAIARVAGHGGNDQGKPGCVANAPAIGSVAGQGAQRKTPRGLHLGRAGVGGHGRHDLLNRPRLAQRDLLRVVVGQPANGQTPRVLDVHDGRVRLQHAHAADHGAGVGQALRRGRIVLC